MDSKKSNHHEYSGDHQQVSSLSANQPCDTSHSTEGATLSKLPNALIGYISEYLTSEEEARLRMSKPTLKRVKRDELRAQGFTPPLTTFFAPPQRTLNYLVLTGRPDYLIKLLQKDPTTFFTKYEKSNDAVGQTFYNVSPADLISFICDDDMQKQVNDFAQALPDEQRDTFFTQWQQHHASRGRGGADLVMTAGMNPPQYASICHATRTFNVLIADQNTPVTGHYHHATKTISWALLKNPDGVICWKNPSNHQLYWYYANHDTQTLEPIDITQEIQAAQQAEYDAFVVRMTAMQPNTARRSSNQEHKLIQTIMRRRESKQPIHLVREGIHYRQDDIDFIDTHYDFNRIINPYLKYLGLPQGRYNPASPNVWRTELSHVQSEIMWLIQRICQIKFSFKPLADNYKEKPFIRSFMFLNLTTQKREHIFDVSRGRFRSGLGVDNSESRLGIYKGGEIIGAVAGQNPPRPDILMNDLVAIYQLIADAIQNIESSPKISLSISPAKAF